MNAQGEDVVAGLRTPRPILEIDEDLPGMLEQLKKVARLLEDHYKDMQDIEFTIERGKLYILQTRAGKRTAQAALEIARALVQEGQISKETAVMRISPEEVSRLLHRAIDPKAIAEAVCQGLPASPARPQARWCSTQLRQRS